MLRGVVRLLTFRATREELLSVDRRHLALGLACTWLVGLGRAWDDPRASLFRHSGVGSLAYVFVLAAVLFLLGWPLRPPDWSYRRVLTFVSLVSPPAALYALPVERWLTADAARATNAWFLGVVALWRVALLLFFLRRLARLSAGAVLVTGLLPLTAIVSALFALNLDKVVFDLMGGGGARSPHDDAYLVLFLLTTLSALAVGPLSVGYVGLVVLGWRRRRRAAPRPAP